MEVVQLSENDSNEIKAFLAEQEFLPVQQTLEWASLQEQLGMKSFRIGLKDDGKLVAYAQGFVRKLPFGFSWLQIPRALLHEACSMKHETQLLIDEIRKIGETEKTVFARFDFQKNAELESPKLRGAKEENFPLATLIIDSTKSEEEIKASMKSKGRYNIRVAEKHGVEVGESKDVGEFFQLLEKTTERDGFSAHTKDYYQKLLDTFGENGKLLVAKKDGKAIGGIILTFAGDTCTYYYGASDHEFRNLMAPYLLQWKGIQLAKERGCKFYDFLGIAPPESMNHHLAGVSSFKLKFGGEIVEYPDPKVLVLKSLAYNFFKIVKGLRG
jgi:peptidoglycan pentaglycine glycine transferase (the first glycine)